MKTMLLLSGLPDLFWLLVVVIVVQFVIIGYIVYDKKRRRQAARDGYDLPTKGHPQLWGNVFFVLSIALSLYLMYSFASSNDLGNQKTFTEVFGNLNAEYLAFSLCVLCAMIILDSLKYLVIMHAIRVKKGFLTALSIGLWGKYYDNITPFSSGGQPMQIYHLHKKGVSGGQSSAIICIKFAFNMTMWLTICLVLMIVNKDILTLHVGDEVQRNLLVAGGWIGFAVNCALPVIILSCALFPKLTWAITRGVLKIGHKLHIVKDIDGRMARGKRAVNDFVTAFVYMLKRPFHSLLLLILCVAEPFLSMTLPFFVVVALGGATVVPSWELMFEIMTLNVYAQMSAMIFPTPGNSGAVESAFMFALTTLSSGALFWTVFSWRFLSYYSYIIIGMVMSVFMLINNNRRRRASASL